MSDRDQKKIPGCNRCYLCGSDDLKQVAMLKEKPKAETDFGIACDEYIRQVSVCNRCGVYNNFHSYEMERIYRKRYNEATYRKDLTQAFNRVMSLPESGSDNKQRVKRIVEFFKKHRAAAAEKAVLDVGSGLCVFLAELKKFGFRCYVIDPDPASIKHATENAGVDGAYTGRFGDLKTEDRKYDLVTFNKVIEHVKDPAAFLANVKRYLAESGIVYIEVPDGEAALKGGPLAEREEFYIEHYTVFTLSSLRYLSEAASLEIVEAKSILEPSGKYTLYAFCRMKK
ncbi:class I SAM-dependent methyltransferase [Candidatus Omnitrophota bacterium]